MKKINVFLISLITLVTLSVGFSSCEPSTVEGKAEKYNKMIREADQLEREGKTDLARKKQAKAMGYGIKVIGEYSNKYDLQSMKKFGELATKEIESVK